MQNNLLEIFDDGDDEELLNEELGVEDRDVRRPADDGVGGVAWQGVMNVVAAQRHAWTCDDRRNDVVNHLPIGRTCK